MNSIIKDDVLTHLEKASEEKEWFIMSQLCSDLRVICDAMKHPASKAEFAARLILIGNKLAEETEDGLERDRLTKKTDKGA